MKPVILTLVLLSPGGATSVEYPEERLQANRPLLERTNENNCACGEWCCKSLSHHCGYVAMAGGWSCFPNDSDATSLVLRPTVTSSSFTSQTGVSPGVTRPSATEPSSSSTTPTPSNAITSSGSSSSEALGSVLVPNAFGVLIAVALLFLVF